MDWANDVDIRSELIKQFGPRNFSASLAIQSKVIMKSEPISNLHAMEYVEEWMEVLEWCAEHPMDKRALVKAFLNGIKPRVLSQELRARNPKTFEQAKVAFIMRVNEHVTRVEVASRLIDASVLPSRSAERSTERNWRSSSAAPVSRQVSFGAEARPQNRSSPVPQNPVRSNFSATENRPSVPHSNAPTGTNLARHFPSGGTRQSFATIVGSLVISGLIVHLSRGPPPPMQPLQLLSRSE